MPSGVPEIARWEGMDLDVNFYWTSADTVAALVSVSGAMIGLCWDRIWKRLVRR